MVMKPTRRRDSKNSHGFKICLMVNSPLQLPKRVLLNVSGYACHLVVGPGDYFGVNRGSMCAVLVAYWIPTYCVYIHQSPDPSSPVCKVVISSTYILLAKLSTFQLGKHRVGTSPREKADRGPSDSGSWLALMTNSATSPPLVPAYGPALCKEAQFSSFVSWVRLASASSPASRSFE
ncbi:uncharacterized protein EI97DRAFT_158014 [Westerdykella ornata]|uniref:Uncharacterized protein n=1 Tax=Westerdykella ornata TaxID=318751 RepID=A0A6A6JB80_WESOR|nr:uncharacterized protein EI97DRAFT_158014 [Westerdykella ornata]KAF2273433.1 hypothetical protein EI97DRAFT_158014 [Westerdykella ornata]